MTLNLVKTLSLTRKKKSHLNYSAFNVKPGRVQTELDTKLGSKQNNLRGIR
jgi:hypothetical protein